jgi:outer membrane protein assembly factor BamB
MGTGSRVRFVVQAFSAQTGKPAWEYKLDAEGPLAPVHIKHNLASPSCATDGSLIYAWFGTGQIVALDFSGKLVWSRHLGKELGPFEIMWGHGSSPLIYKDTVYLLCDHQGRAYLLAVDKRTGKDRWRVDRGADRRAYSTPFLIPGRSGDELVINSSERVDVFDPATGKLLWSFGEENRVPVPTPVLHDGTLYLSRGYSSSPFLAMRAAERKAAWEVPTGAPYVSSMLYYQGVLYMATEMGIASAVDAGTGKLLWRTRLGGVFSASPVAAAGKVYLINEEGEAFVLEAGRTLRILHRNRIGERLLASPAISGGRLFLRTDEHLICVGK